MHKYLSIIILLISNQVLSQTNTQNLIGEWIQVKNRMADGSKNLTQTFSSSMYNRWKFFSNKLCIESDPINSYKENGIDYKLQNNYIKTSSESGYEIAKLTSDSLIVIQRMKGVNENDKLEKIWFVKSAIIRNEYINKHKNDTILTANEYFTPTLKKNFINEIHKNFLNKTSYPNFNLSGKIVFYPKKEKIEVEITNIENKNSINDKKAVEYIQKTIQKTYPYWDLNDFKNFNKVIIPFVIKSESTQTYKGSPIFYFIDINDIDKVYGIKLEDMRLSGQNFENGIKAFQEKKYENAIEFFKKSFEIDPRKIDALYNIVSIYSLLNDKTNRCAYLKKLYDLEQTEGIKMYKENCIN
ncbi:tetratricopeptide repeat protein [Flavobacterium oreochromis]|uniref:tetratricopeptide repeat protein n=1 Tax=Flavobacterium oreochromis TaxID=2906078 RepID=UPI00385E5787